jgi:hypothetical protein
MNLYLCDKLNEGDVFDNLHGFTSVANGFCYISLPAPITEAVTLRKVEGGIVAVNKFSGRPKEEIVLQKEKDLRSQLLKDGLKPQQGCLLARYNDPRTKSFLMV